jgi:hypothetical protein
MIRGDNQVVWVYETFNHAEPYRGVFLQQAKNFEKPFEKLFNRVSPSTILEIGTGEGGTSLILNKILKDNKHNYKYYTYDVTFRPPFNLLMEDGIDVRIENIFTKDWSSISERHYDEISSIIKREGVTIVMCDGGDKIMEFNLLAKLLKPGDIIMAHDYAKDFNFFNSYVKNKIWNWCEITNSDIIDAIYENNLEPLMEEEFQQVVWVCKRKQI